MMHHVVGWLILVLLVAAPGCGKPQGNRKPTAPVTGRVTVNGAAPGSSLKVECHPLQGMDQENPSVSSCMTEPDGSFSISTYEQGDGVPEGEYALTFVWGELNLISRSYGGKDKLGGKYDTPDESPRTFTVTGSTPVDLGILDLKAE